MALHVVHCEEHEALLLPAIKLLYCLAAVSPPPASIRTALSSELHVGELLALTTQPSPYLSNASKALLACTPLGQRARSGEPVGRAQLGEAQYAKFEARMARMKEGQSAADSVDGNQPGEGSKGSGPEQVRCAGCGRAQEGAASFAACGRCKIIRYCGKECQTRHWRQHKAECHR